MLKNSEKFYDDYFLYFIKYTPVHAQIFRPTLKSKLWLITHFKSKKFGMGVGTVFLGRTHGCERQKVSSLSKTYPNAFQNLAWLKIKFQEDNTTKPIFGQH